MKTGLGHRGLGPGSNHGWIYIQWYIRSYKAYLVVYDATCVTNYCLIQFLWIALDAVNWTIYITVFQFNGSNSCMVARHVNVDALILHLPRPRHLHVLPSAIDTSLFTHIFYTFLSPSNETYRFEVSASTAALLSNFTSSPSRKTPRVKTLISIGGGEAGPSLYAQMASSAATREALIDSSIWVARRIGFDGLDLDWEFPENPAQMDDFSKLLAES
ncbi:hypothetical protein SAY86_026701 [Trapa natans]|uniref:GH18 domain-containing protein n=1 Tax=Trapa natans TaxID=22666 RepID=A0AAN7KEQ9_TRANT|nr:hypothetical protein SAY86_026701 [Trapa natans]